jgi:hypothetical protein
MKYLFSTEEQWAVRHKAIYLCAVFGFILNMISFAFVIYAIGRGIL